MHSLLCPGWMASKVGPSRNRTSRQSTGPPKGQYSRGVCSPNTHCCRVVPRERFFPFLSRLVCCFRGLLKCLLLCCPVPPPSSSRVSFRIHSLDYEDSRRPHPLMMDSAEQRLTVEGRAMKLGNGNRPVRHIPPADNCNSGELGLAQISFSRSSKKKKKGSSRNR